MSTHIRKTDMLPKSPVCFLMHLCTWTHKYLKVNSSAAVKHEKPDELRAACSRYIKHHMNTECEVNKAMKNFSFSGSQQREPATSTKMWTSCCLTNSQTVNRTDLNVKAVNRGRIITMRTSSQRLAAVRKREAMLLASVNCSSLCLNLGSYLPMEKDTSHFHLCSYVPRPDLPDWLTVSLN